MAMAYAKYLSVQLLMTLRGPVIVADAYRIRLLPSTDQIDTLYQLVQMVLVCTIDQCR